MRLEMLPGCCGIGVMVDLGGGTCKKFLEVYGDYRSYPVILFADRVRGTATKIANELRRRKIGKVLILGEGVNPVHNSKIRLYSWVPTAAYKKQARAESKKRKAAKSAANPYYYYAFNPGW